MFSEDYYIKYFEKSYTPQLNSVIKFIRVGENVELDESMVIKEIELIFNSKDVREIFLKWSSECYKKLTQKMNDFFLSLDLSLDWGKLFSIISNSDIINEYGLEFIESEFVSFYISKKINAKLDNGFLDTNINSILFETSIIGSLLVEYDETSEVIIRFKKFINDWYSKNILEKRLETFFENTSLVLGERNWEVVNKLYGRKPYEKIMDWFINETPEQKNLILSEINMWYEKNIYESSEKAWKNLFL